mmetsp:Transcript_38697/g.122981  ORF Transcript_38697/g.122981 Transcript_38697/m.122981 type:complete len:245 (-) Transcript_38697:96-830(-)
MRLELEGEVESRPGHTLMFPASGRSLAGSRAQGGAAMKTGFQGASHAGVAAAVTKRRRSAPASPSPSPVGRQSVGLPVEHSGAEARSEGGTVATPHLFSAMYCTHVRVTLTWTPLPITPYPQSRVCSHCGGRRRGPCVAFLSRVRRLIHTAAAGRMLSLRCSSSRPVIRAEAPVSWRSTAILMEPSRSGNPFPADPPWNNKGTPVPDTLRALESSVQARRSRIARPQRARHPHMLCSEHRVISA